MLSNVLSSADLYEDDLQGYNNKVGVSELSKSSPHVTDQYSLSDDSGIIPDFDSWLDEATYVGQLDERLQIPFSSIQQTLALAEIQPDDPVADVLAELEAAMEPSLHTPVSSFQAQAEFLMQDPKISFTQMEAPRSSGLDAPVTPPPSEESIDAPSSPAEQSRLGATVVKPVVKYVQPSTIDVRGLSRRHQVVMDDMNVFHLPEIPDGDPVILPPGVDSAVLHVPEILHLPSDPAILEADQAMTMLLEALANPNLAGELNILEVESLLSSPPSSPDACVPGTPDSDEEYRPSRKRKAAGSPQGRSRSLKALKPSEKKERKKQQNKTAATKYRLKKRAEDVGSRQELNQLEERNTELKRQADDLASEIKYMKGLLNDVLKSKGLRIK